MPVSSDARIRIEVFAWFTEQVDHHGDVLPHSLLRQGLIVEGHRVPLISRQGIFKPAVMDLPLTITTSPKSPYNDDFTGEDLLSYRYRGTDPHHRENVGLRECMRRNTPLVYLRGITPGSYFAAWPVYVVGDDPIGLTFTIACDDARTVTAAAASTQPDLGTDPTQADLRRRYITSATRVRLHQRTFRERVLDAYRRQCAFCRFRHDELLEAAHIIPDHDERGEPVVSNGLSLCNLHHAAYDRGFLGVRPDYVIEVRPDILAEQDGPTLRHGLQGLHRTRIVLPRKQVLRPAPERLEMRYRGFLDGSSQRFKNRYLCSPVT